MKKLLTLLSLLFAATASAQSMREVLPTIPDSICRLLTRNNLLDFPDYLDTQMKAEVRNRLGGNSEMKTLTDDYTLIQVSESSTLQFKLLPTSKSKLILAAHTYFLNDSIADSQLSIYDLSWKQLPTEKYLKLTAQPNTVVQAVLSSSTTDLQLRSAKPFQLSPASDEPAPAPTPTTATYHWNGKVFKNK